MHRYGSHGKCYGTYARGRVYTRFTISNVSIYQGIPVATLCTRYSFFVSGLISAVVKFYQETNETGRMLMWD